MSKSKKKKRKKQKQRDRQNSPPKFYKINHKKWATGESYTLVDQETYDKQLQNDKDVH